LGAVKTVSNNPLVMYPDTVMVLIRMLSNCDSDHKERILVKNNVVQLVDIKCHVHAVFFGHIVDRVDRKSAYGSIQTVFGLIISGTKAGAEKSRIVIKPNRKFPTLFSFFQTIIFLYTSDKNTNIFFSKQHCSQFYIKL
jgi:hypothetical protein